MATDDSNPSSQGVPGPGDESAKPADLSGTAPKRRRRRRKPVAKPTPGGVRSPDLVSLDPTLTQEDAEEAMAQPSASVRDQEAEREESRASQGQDPFVVSMAPDEPASASGDLIYEAPVYQPRPPQTPSEPQGPVEPQGPLQPQGPVEPQGSLEPQTPFEPYAFSEPPAPLPGAEPVGVPVQDPYAWTQPPVTLPASTPPPYAGDPWAPAPSAAVPAQAPFAPVSPEPYGPPSDPFSAYESPFAPAPSPAPSAPPPSLDPFQPVSEPPPVELAPLASPEPVFAPPPEPAPSYEALPYDLAAAAPASPRTPESVSEPALASAPFVEDRAPVIEGPLEGEVVESTPPLTPQSTPDASVKPSVPTSAELQESASFKDRLHDLLAEANLTPKHVRFCCAGVVLMVLIVLLAVFLLPKFLSGDWFSEEPKAVEVETPSTPETPDPVDPSTSSVGSLLLTVAQTKQEAHGEPSAPVTSGTSWVDPSIYTGLLVGETDASVGAFDSSGTGVGLILGETSVDSPDIALSQFQVFLSDLEDLYTIYFVDIQALLDGSSDRAEALDAHLEELRTLYQRGTDNYNAIESILQRFDESFEADEVLKDEAEAQFFAEVGDFDGADAEVELLEFIEFKQSQVDLKAKYLAFKEVQSRYETVMNAVFPLIQDLEANREALIAGVQVVDVIGSDLDLILGEDDLEAAAE